MKRTTTAVLVGSLAALGAPATGAAAAPDPATGADARYALQGGCYVLRAGGRDASGPLRFQATDLGSYLLYTKDRRFLTAGGDGTVVAAAEPGPSGDWRVRVEDGAFRLSTLGGAGKSLVARGDRLAVAGAPGAFTVAEADGCPAYPEVETNISGEAPKGASPFAEVTGMFDGHLHMMAYEFLGGRVHCGAPWHRYGAPYALPDCGADPVAGAGTSVTDAAYANEVGTDLRGWPTFQGWPNHQSVTYEQTYWKWVERAWRGGLRLFVNLLVDNEALCNVYPLKRNPCNDMNSVRLQHRRIHQLQDYIDAQHGGPGKGFFRIVTSPFEARRVINDGKLAVVLGIEVSRLFECGVINDAPQCTAEEVDRRLDEVHRMGVRGMELVNKFDNAFSGVAGDAGMTGVLVNAANFATTGSFWNMQTCQGDGHDHDREQTTPAGKDRDSIFNGLASLLPLRVPPLYPAGPHCNARGLTQLGEHLVERMIDKGMMIDPDHMSVRARAELLTILEKRGYPGTISSHSWSDVSSIPRILRLGGVVSPMAGSSERFAKSWRETRAARDTRRPFGIGFGADMNGFASQGAPRSDAAQRPLTYPFKTIHGLTADKQRSGQRTFDFNRDGVAHYGMFVDWAQDLRVIEGDDVVRDLAKGAEAYLQTWERAFGVPAQSCRSARMRLTGRGLASVRLGTGVEPLLRRAGQPGVRTGRVMRWCAVKGDAPARGRVTALFGAGERVSLVASTAPGHEALGVGTGDRASALRATRPLSTGLRVRDAGAGKRFVFGVRGGRVRFVAVADRATGRSAATLRRALRAAGLR
ncbi:MAG TPA: Coagulation factor 5/8 type domain-containing protein [Baekduia sp.]|nr:Coagulation factor 5/8 type domain-containing protein [Baekduia sp.]